MGKILLLGVIATSLFCVSLSIVLRRTSRIGQFSITMVHPTKTQQNAWRSELGITGDEKGNPETYELDQKRTGLSLLKTFTTKWISTHEADPIGDGNCFWRVVAYFLTRDQDNYLSIKQAIADFVENNPSVLQDIDAERNADGTMLSPADFITKTRLKVDGFGYIDTDLYPLIALRFKVHIYILWSADPKESYWAHVAPGNELKANDNHPSIMIRYTGKHNRIIKDVLPSASLTIDNDWNSCEFKVIAFPPERANLPKDRRTFSAPLLIDPKDADVQKIEQLITIQINHYELKSMKGKMAFSYINKDGVEEPIKPGQKLGSPPYNFACGGRQTIYARIKH